MTSGISKVVKRTLVGGSLVAILGFLVWLSYRSENGLVVWVVGAVLTIECVREVLRMDRLVPRSLAVPLLLGAAGAIAVGGLHYAGIAVGVEELDVLIADFPGARSVEASYALGLGLALVAWIVGRIPRRGAGLVREGALLAFLALWLPAQLPAMVLVWEQFGPDGLLALIGLSKIGDVFGYYVGNAIGRRHPFPTISPGKTAEGYLASFAAGALAGYLCVLLGLFPAGATPAAGVAAGALTTLAAQAGDLLESRVKRAAGVKDSAGWFGPSGGVLDLVDSLLLSTPAALLTWPLLFA